MDPDPRLRFVKEGIRAAKQYVSLFTTKPKDARLSDEAIRELQEAHMDLVSASRHIDACESLMRGD
jgi:hypothetical protein